MKLEREWKLKDQELMNYLRKLEFKMRNSSIKGRTEESKKLSEEWKTIMKISYNSNPNILQTWNPLRIQRIIEKVYKKAQEKELGTDKIKKDNSMTKKQINETEMKWHIRLKELADNNPDPKLVRTMLLAFKDYDEGRIDMERLKILMEEFKQSANRIPTSQEITEKYPIFNPLKKKRKK